MVWNILLAAVVVQSFYFVRHGETEANATSHYNAKSLNQFSARGAQEVQQLTKELLKMPKFDLILVSPAPRTLRTIAPYLQRTGQKAYVWPLLYECCTGKRPAGARPTRFTYTGSYKIPADLAPYFLSIRGESRLPNAPTYSEGLAQVQAAVAEFNRSFLGKRVLLVGHSGQGGHFIHDMTGKWIQLKNAELHEITLR